MNALTSAFSGAGNAYNASQNIPIPTDFVSQMTPDQLSVFSRMMGTGGDNLGNATGLIGSGASGASNALERLVGIDPSASNNMMANIAGGMAYAAGADIPSAVRNAMHGAFVNARDVLVPGIETDAAGSGNINSSRTGLAEGMVARDLADRSADLAGSMYTNLYNTGAGLTHDTNSGNIGALTSALASAMGGGNALFNSGSQGARDFYNMMTTGAAGPQQAGQLSLDNLLQRYNANMTGTWAPVQNYYGIVGANNWGQNTQGQQQQTQYTTPSAMQTVGQLMGAGGSLLGSKAGAFGGGSGLLGMSPTLFGLL